MVIITRKREVAARYLGYLHREIGLLAAHLGGRRRVVQYHWGGGTPTYLSPAQMEELHAVVPRHFDVEPGAEVAIEVDPRVTTFEQIGVLRRLGFNRLSMGVQDFTPEVQQAVNRVQSEEETRALFDHARDRGFLSINVDLIYGLPRQTLDSFLRTVDTVMAMRPDRVAAYSFAHVPWIRGNQKGIHADELPAPELKLGLFVAARERFLEAGYEAIGMDHFALPGDELAVATRARHPPPQLHGLHGEERPGHAGGRGLGHRRRGGGLRPEREEALAPTTRPSTRAASPSSAAIASTTTTASAAT